jgi:hypothetical protein
MRATNGNKSLSSDVRWGRCEETSPEDFVMPRVKRAPKIRGQDSASE